MCDSVVFAVHIGAAAHPQGPAPAPRISPLCCFAVKMLGAQSTFEFNPDLCDTVKSKFPFDLPGQH